ncbi:MAG TPA: hypothetical protein VK034_24170 [Enhygromyxa sp.]|nr:hypothetical protein [Enhygromyxa sp.]
MSLSGLVASGPEFIPNEDSREWIAAGIVELAGRLGPIASQPRLLTDGSDLGFGASKTPRDLDSLFDLICATQEVVGQSEVELTLLEVDERGTPPKLPDSFASLGDSRGKLLHTVRGPDEYLLLFTPAVFKVRELMLASVARELGRIALDRVGLEPDPETGLDGLQEWEADSELAGILLGMGIWVANGAYLFENSCCGGGCGVDLRSVRAGLSLPEASYALALDSQRKGIRRRHVLRHLSATQKAACKKCWGHLGDALPPALAAADPEVRGALRG